MAALAVQWDDEAAPASVSGLSVQWDDAPKPVAPKPVAAEPSFLGRVGRGLASNIGAVTGSLRNSAESIIEPLVTMGTGMAGVAVGNVAGAVGDTYSRLRGTALRGDDVNADIRKAMTYQSRNPAAQANLERFGQAMSASKLEGLPILGAELPMLGRAIRQQAPMTRAAAGAAADVPISAMQRGVSAGIDRATASKSMKSLRDGVLERGRAIGLAVPNSEVAPTFIGNRLESASGKAALKQELVLRNQDAATVAAGKSIGWPENVPMDRAGLDDLIKNVSEPYRQVGELPSVRRGAYGEFGNPKADLADLVETRQKAQLAWDDFNFSGGRPRAESMKEAKALTARATELESNLIEYAQSAGRTDLIPQLLAARVRIAKIHAVRRALNPAGTDVSASVLGAMLKKDRPLDGDLRTIAEFQQQFPKFMGEGVKSPRAGISALETAAATTAGFAGAIATGKPAGALMAGIPLLRHPIRAAMLSKAMQTTPTYGPGLMNRIGQGIVGEAPGAMRRRLGYDTTAPTPQAGPVPEAAPVPNTLPVPYVRQGMFEPAGTPMPGPGTGWRFGRETYGDVPDISGNAPRPVAGLLQNRGAPDSSIAQSLRSAQERAYDLPYIGQKEFDSGRRPPPPQPEIPSGPLPDLNYPLIPGTDLTVNPLQSRSPFPELQKGMLSGGDIAAARKTPGRVIYTDANGQIIEGFRPPTAPKIRDLFAELRKAGGLNKSELADLGMGASKALIPRKNGLVPKEGGRKMNSVVEFMEQNGWLTAEDIAMAERSGIGGSHELARDMIRSAVDGDTPIHPLDGDAHYTYQAKLKELESQGIRQTKLPGKFFEDQRKKGMMQ